MTANVVGGHFYYITNYKLINNLTIKKALLKREAPFLLKII